MAKTLPVNVYHADSFRYCANGGVTEQVDTLYLVGVEGAFCELPDADPRILKLVASNIFGRVYTHAEPVNPCVTEGMVGPMMGGNFVYSSDSRFPADYPIPVHDRYETQEQYDLLST